jgi:hypothetical protein
LCHSSNCFLFFCIIPPAQYWRLEGRWSNTTPMFSS